MRPVEPPPADEGHDPRPEIAKELEWNGVTELVHEASGVRVVVSLDSAGRRGGETLFPPGYRLAVPVASLDRQRGQRHRARAALEDLAWRQYDADDVPPPTLCRDDDTVWSFATSHGDAADAADAALRLLCTIAGVTIAGVTTAGVATDVRVQLRAPRDGLR